MSDHEAWEEQIRQDGFHVLSRSKATGHLSEAPHTYEEEESARRDFKQARWLTDAENNYWLIGVKDGSVVLQEGPR